MLLKRFYDDQLAQASYLIGCAATGESIVIDANRDVQQYIDAASDEGMRITHVTETHIHADFVSGSRELAERTGGRLHLSVEGGPDWQYTFPEAAGAVQLRDRSRFKVGNIIFDALHTPGHTPEHLSFLVTDGAASTEPYAIFTGDFVFIGDVGRPDLLEKAAKVANTMDAAARTLYHALATFRALPEFVQVYPGHGAGSACGKSLGALPSSTVGYELRTNWGLQPMTEEAFVAAVLEGQPAPPAYFAQMKHVNKVGPAILGPLVPVPMLAPAELPKGRTSGAVLVDVRPATDFAMGHLAGSLNIPFGKSFVTWAGWLLPYHEDLYLIAADARQADAARTALTFIGLDRVTGYFDAVTLEAERQARGGLLPTVLQFDASAAATFLRAASPTVIDVRNPAEFAAGHLVGAHNIPLGELPHRLAELPIGAPLLVHCAGGARSAIAASVLLRAGFLDLTNLIGGYSAWLRAGLPVESGPVLATAGAA